MKVKFSRCNSNSLANVPQVDGQLIYVKDTSEVYMDVGNNRNKLSDIIEVADITNVQNPIISKIYYDEATESLYKYVNNNWKNLSGSNLVDLFVNIPAAVMQLTDESTPEEIFAAFGGKQKLQDIIVELRKCKYTHFVDINEEYNEDIELYGDEQPHLEIVSSFTSITRYSIESIETHMIEIKLDWRDQVVHSIMFLGVGYEDDELTIISDENVGINRMDLVFPSAEDVLEKENTTPFTPTEDYNPATKKYVDDCISTYTPTSTSTTFDNTGTGLQATNVQDAIEELLQKINDLETTVGQVGAILDEINGEVIEDDITDVVYTTNFTLNPETGYYEASGAGNWELSISFTKHSVGTVSLNYKGNKLAGMESSSYIYLDNVEDNISSSSEYTNFDFENVTAGTHTIRIVVNSGDDRTNMSVKLLT